MPPRLFHRFFRWYCHPRLRNGIEGDLIEFYREREKRSGKRIADLLFAVDVLLLFRPAIIRPAEGYKRLNHYGMPKNYFTTGWRALMRNKGYSAINIGGLAAGMAVTITIAMWIADELSFNRYFRNYDSVGWIITHSGRHGTEATYYNNPIPLADELRLNFPQDFKHVSIATWDSEYSLTSGENKFFERGMFMEPDGPEILSLEMVYGTRRALSEPNTVMISESLARKLFGDADPIGQTTRIRNEIDVRIGGVYKDLPPNTDFYKLSLIGSWNLLLSWQPWIREKLDSWDWNSHQVLVQLNDNVTFEQASARIRDIKKSHLSEINKETEPELLVHAMSRWHLYSKFENRTTVTSDQLQFVWLYGIIGVFVLSLACVNFMNLSTARSEKRAKEVGIRKTMGSLRNQLIIQFFSESYITVVIAVAASIFLVVLALPVFNEVATKQITFPWTNLIFWSSILGFALFVGLLAGSYPAFYLSAFKPISVLKGTFRSGRYASLPRKILVVFQFTVSVLLIVGTIVVYRQIDHARNRPVGYTREGLITVFKSSPDLWRRSDAIRSELVSSGAVASVAGSSSPATGVWDYYDGFEWEGMPEMTEQSFAVTRVTEAYGETVGWQFIEGRDFSGDIASDTNAVIINRTMARLLGMSDPIDQVIKWNNVRFNINTELRIIGVIEDMAMQSPYTPVDPSVFIFSRRGEYVINMRLNPSLGTLGCIARIAPIFQKYNPSVPFQFKFVDDEYESKFAAEVRVGKLAFIFSALAILISLLGIFGLSAFAAEQRTKEIGIRKVVGASLFSLWSLLTRNFIGLVLLSCLIAFPMAWYLLSGWLLKFQYRIDIQWWLFPVVATGALMVTVITVSYQAIRAALANPVKSLKAE